MEQDLAVLITNLRHADEYEPLGHDGWVAADALEAQAAEIARLRDALKPFGAAIGHVAPEIPDDYRPNWAEFFTLGDFRRADAALQRKAGE